MTHAQQQSAALQPALRSNETDGQINVRSGLQTGAPAAVPERSLWPRAIITYFVVVILCIAFYITWAVRQNMDLVRKDYYAGELQFQKQLDQANRAVQHNWKPEIGYDRVRDVVAISLSNRSASISGSVQFYRPSDAALDKNHQAFVGQRRLATNRCARFFERSLESACQLVCRCHGILF